MRTNFKQYFLLCFLFLPNLLSYKKRLLSVRQVIPSANKSLIASLSRAEFNLLLSPSLRPRGGGGQQISPLQEQAKGPGVQQSGVSTLSDVHTKVESPNSAISPNVFPSMHNTRLYVHLKLDIVGKQNKTPDYGLNWQ